MALCLDTARVPLIVLELLVPCSGKPLHVYGRATPNHAKLLQHDLDLYYYVVH